MLDSGADIGMPSISEAVLGQLEARLTLKQGFRTVGLAEGGVGSVTHKAVHLHLTVHTPWGPVVFDPQPYACMPGSDKVTVVGRATLDKLVFNLKNQTFQFARARTAGYVAGVENPGFVSSRRVMLSVYALQNGRGMGQEPDEAVKQPTLVNRKSGCEREGWQMKGRLHVVFHVPWM